MLGRCGREQSCEVGSQAVGGLSQKLHLMNGKLLNKRISAKGSRLQKLFKGGTRPQLIIEAFYLVAICRFPSAAEKERWQTTIDSLDSGEAKLGFLEDFVPEASCKP